MGVVKCINVYPVKSCMPMSVMQARLTPTGFMFDRQWVIVRADTGKFISQRQQAKLALVKVTLPTELFTCDNAEAVRNTSPDAVLTLSIPGGAPVSVPVLPGGSQQTRQVTVWDWSGPAADEGDAIAEYLSSYLGLPVRLVRYIGSEAHQRRMGSLQPPPTELQPEAAVRSTTPEYAVGFETSFADGFPLLLTSEASMADVNTRIPAGDLSVNRFRGNIIIDGEEAWAEDGWREVEIVPAAATLQPIALINVKPCERCKVPSIEQETGTVSGEEPLAAMRTFRTGTLLGWAQHKKSFTHSVFFGINLVPKASGVVSVGDEVRRVSPWVAREEGFVPVVA